MKTISFDFDDTICLWPEARVNQPIKDLIWKHKNAGDRVVLVTSRWSFTQEAIEIGLAAWDVPIESKDMFFSNGADKSIIFANHVAVDAHYDDDVKQLHSLRSAFDMSLFQVIRENIIEFDTKVSDNDSSD